ncbi:Trafficking protein particle complex subunit 33 [Allomyces javanicus]|nr:Trafficking protein particle complex subunit 33 [Allomyces javanicus]
MSSALPSYSTTSVSGGSINNAPASSVSAVGATSFASGPLLVAEPALFGLLMEMGPALEAAMTGGDREAVFFKMEMLGYNVGQRLVERLAKDHARFTDTLDVVKFICKEFWMAVFRKQVDNLKTNHRGVYVLQDNNFRWFMNASGATTLQDATQAMTPFLWFPCGLIRGALAGLGYATVVMAESVGIPQCTFQIKIATGR